MKFSEVIEHLSERGFVKRRLWEERAVLFFGMDNIPWLSSKDGQLSQWTPNLDEMKAEDWVELDYYWNGSLDNYVNSVIGEKPKPIPHKSTRTRFDTIEL